MASKLILTRKGEWFNRRQIYKVLINDQQAGVIKNDSTEEYELAPGSYTVQCKHNWTSSPIVSITIKSGEKSYLQVSNGMKYIVPLYILMLVGLFFPLYFKFQKIPMPDAVPIIKIILIFPALIYILLYLSILRKRYLNLGEDKSNPFS